MRIQHQAPALDVSLPPLRAGWRWPPRDMLDAAIGEVVFNAGLYPMAEDERDRILDRREWPEGRHVIDGHEAARLTIRRIACSPTTRHSDHTHCAPGCGSAARAASIMADAVAKPARAASSTITVGAQLHDELTDVTPITPEAEAALELRLVCARDYVPVLGSMSTRDGVRHQAGVEAAFARMAKLSDKTMREIRDHADHIMREREAEAERAARRVERVAEVVFVSLVAIGFLLVVLRMSWT